MSWRRNRRHRDEDDEDMYGFDFRFGFDDIDEMIESMLRTAKSLPAVEGPLFYGYSVTLGPDGRPNVKEFGNIKPTTKGTFEMGAREPFVDTVVDEKEGRLKVVAEMPGLEKEDIQLQAHENSLTIRAERGDRRYDTTVPLSLKVEPSSAKASYNNGVLEINLRLKEGQKQTGVNIKID